MFIFKKERSSEYDLSNIKMELQSQCITLEEILGEFGNFLKACGYRFEGEIRVCNDE